MMKLPFGNGPSGLLVAVFLFVASAGPVTTGCAADDTDDTPRQAISEPEGATSRPPDKHGIPAALGAIGDTSTLNLPAGKPGEVSIIARQERADELGTMAVVIRNNTDGPVGDVQLTGEVTDDTGASLGSVISQQSFEPPVLQPGEIAIGWVFVNDTRRNGTVTFTVTSEPADQVDPEDRYATVDVNLVERSGTKLVGKLRNSSGGTAGPFVAVNVMCFGGDGAIRSYHEGFADESALAAGTDGTFAVDLGSDVCEVALVGAHGDPNV